MYQRHYNRHVAALWWKHREVLRAVSRRFGFTLARRATVLREHRELIALTKAQDADRAAADDRAPRRGLGPAHSRADAGPQRRRRAV